jgi:hypothetical protein
MHGSIVHATLVGRFFSGRLIKYPKGSSWGGYGHMGCCTLLAIQGIKSVDVQNRDDLDYGAGFDQPDIGKVGCGYHFLTPIDSTTNWIKAQQEADLSQRDWVFDDPQRVASEAIARFANVEGSSVALKETHNTQGRHVYEWKPADKHETYMVVVSRPYLLAFYAHDPKRVNVGGSRCVCFLLRKRERTHTAQISESHAKLYSPHKEAHHEISRRTRQSALLSRAAVSVVRDTPPKNK